MISPKNGKDNWIENKDNNYIYYDGVQFSDTEKKYRCKRLTASNCARAAELTPAYYGTKEELARDILGIEKKIPDRAAIVRMTRGTKMEPHIRQLYEKKTGNTVHEIGLAIPKWNTRIGASLDGIIVDGEGKGGSVEIKCPGTGDIYPGLSDMLKKNRGDYDKYYHDHIKIEHYCQMQMGMIITGRPSCDYVVWGYETNRLYVERVWFNSDFWLFLYDKILSFLKYMDEYELEYNS